MNEFTEALVVLSKCGEVHKTYGIRTEKKSVDSWAFTWAFPIRESSAKREGYDKSSIRGNIQCTEEYPGCPYCKQRNFIFCSGSGHINCYVVKGDTFTCEWCSMQGKLVDYTGEAIKAGTDL